MEMDLVAAGEEGGEGEALHRRQSRPDPEALDHVVSQATRVHRHVGDASPTCPHALPPGLSTGLLPGTAVAVSQSPANSDTLGLSKTGVRRRSSFQSFFWRRFQDEK